MGGESETPAGESALAGNRRGALRLRGLTAAVWLVVMVVAVLLGQSIANGQYAVLALAGAALAGALLAGRDQRTIQVVLVVSFVLAAIIALLQLQAQAAYATDLLILLMATSVVLRSTRKRNLTVDANLVPWAAFLALRLVAGGPFGFLALQSFVGYVLFPVLYLCVLNSEMDRESQRRVVWTIVALLGVQVVVAAVQKVAFYWAPADRIGGTLARAGTPFMGVLMASWWAAIVAFALATGRKRLYFLLPLPLLPIVVGEVKAGFVLAAIGTAVVMMAVVASRRVARRWLVGALLVVVPLVAALSVYLYAPQLISGDYATREYGIKFFSTPTTAIDYLSGYGRTGQAHRLELLRVILQRHNEATSLLLGEGLGTLSSSALLGQASYEPGSVGATFGWATSGAKYLLETGVLGLVLFGWLVASLAMRAYRLFTHSEDPLWRPLGLAFAGVAAVFIVGGFYTSAWSFDATAASFWVLAGLVAREEGLLRGA